MLKMPVLFSGLGEKLLERNNAWIIIRGNTVCSTYPQKLISQYILLQQRRPYEVKCIASFSHLHYRKVCEIQRYAALSNTVKRPCNTLYFSLSRLVCTPFLK